MKAIHADKIDQDTFNKLAAPLFSSLRSLCEERKRLIKEVEDTFRAQIDEWLKRPTGVLRRTELTAALAKYDGYVEKINVAIIKQASVLKDLQVRLISCATFKPAEE